MVLNEMNVSRLPRALPILLALAASPAPGRTAEHTAATPRLPSFELEDQRGLAVRRADVAGHPLLLVGADRRGREESVRWAKQLRLALRARPGSGDVLLLRVADLTSVPPPARAIARRMVKDAYEVPLLLDWRGALADTLRFDPGAANVLAFTPDGALIERRVGPPRGQAEALALVDRLLAASAPGPGPDPTPRSPR